MPLKLEITLRDDGGIEMAGPLGQKLLCLGMIEAAKPLILAFKPEPEKKIVPAHVVLPFKNNGH